MKNSDNTSPRYEFSDKYDPDHAKQYFEKHHDKLGSRLITWREISMARKALELAGSPKSVLDLPCGTGRFWEMLAEDKIRNIYVADNSQAMIDTGLRMRPKQVTAQISQMFQCSAFATGLPDKFVECVFSMRLMHHINKSEDRIVMLKEFARISSATVVVSLWVDGNFGAWQRARLERRRVTQGYKGPHNRFVIPQHKIEHEFSTAGLDVIGHVDFLKYLDKKRAYVLKVRPT